MKQQPSAVATLESGDRRGEANPQGNRERAGRCPGAYRSAVLRRWLAGAPCRSRPTPDVAAPSGVSSALEFFGRLGCMRGVGQRCDVIVQSSTPRHPDTRVTRFAAGPREDKQRARRDEGSSARPTARPLRHRLALSAMIIDRLTIRPIAPTTIRITPTVARLMPATWAVTANFRIAPTMIVNKLSPMDIRSSSGRELLLDTVVQACVPVQ